MATRRSLAQTTDATDLRQRILDASERLLETEGLAALSMREVARRSGVTHQAPYHHFADRESILAELVTRGFDELTRRLALVNARRADTDHVGNPTHFLVESGLAYVGYAIDHPGVFRIMFRAEVCDCARFPAALNAGECAYRELEQMVAMLHGAGAVDRLAGVYWSQVHGLASLIVDGPIGLQLPSLPKRRSYAQAVLAEFAHLMLQRP